MNTNNTPAIAYPSKGGFKWKTISETVVTGAEVVNYLVNTVFGIPNMKVSLITWHGPNRGCYVITKLCIPTNEMVANQKPKDFVGKVMDQFGANSKYRDEILELVAPFKFPDATALDLAMRDPEKVKQFTNLGIYGKNLLELKQFCDFRNSVETGYHIIYLDTEKILKQMSEDPTNDKVIGDFRVKEVYGEKDETIRWKIAVYRDQGAHIGNSGFDSVAIDRIIGTAR